MKIVQYSEKSVALFGVSKDDKQLHAILKTDCCGKFQPFLKVDGNPTPGWIFGIKRLDKVKEVISKWLAPKEEKKEEISLPEKIEKPKIVKVESKRPTPSRKDDLPPVPSTWVIPNTLPPTNLN